MCIEKLISVGTNPVHAARRLDTTRGIEILNIHLHMVD